jgi:ribonuclease E
MKRILINATQTEELRVAIVDITTQGLLDLLVERRSYITKTGNIYMGTITAIEPSLDACFINFGSERHGFLPFKEIVPNYYTNDLTKPGRSAIKDALKIGQKIMVQVEKEERGNKGAALTTYISLAGSYLVLMPNNPSAGGISRRVEGTERDDLRETLSNLPIPEDMGLIVRTAGVGKETDELQWDLANLLKQWEAIQKASIDRSPPFLIHQESDIVIRAIRDHLREDVTEILVDDTTVFERIKEHLQQIRPDFVHCLKQYTSNIPLFNRYQIEHQIEAAHEREVRLPSGGSIVIGHTEALVAIDVNSGQATKGRDIEQTAFEINKEAARVIACQLRLRDIGGLVVIDFIDMPSARHRREVEGELRNALKLDKARTQIGTISPRFGLLEMSRQRLRHSLGEATRTICARCDGWGTIRSVESLSLSILRMIEEDAIRPGTTQIQVQLPVDLATFIINEKREHIAGIEKNQNTNILIIPNAKLESPHYRIKRLTETETGSGKPLSPSYRLAGIEEPDTLYKKGAQFKPAEEKPAVQSLFAEAASATRPVKKPAPGLMKRLISSLLGTPTESNDTSPKKEATPTTARPVNTPDRNQRNQERAHPRGNQRHSSAQPRKPRSISTPERKAAPSLPAVSSHATTTAPSVAPTTTTPPQQQTPGSRPRRGGRTGAQQGGAQQQRRPNQQPPAPVQPAKPTAPLNPPNYPQPSLSDSDLEAYYRESAGFVDKKSARTLTTPGSTPNFEHKTTTEAAHVPSREPVQHQAVPPQRAPQPHVAPVSHPVVSTTSEQHVPPTKVDATPIEKNAGGPPALPGKNAGELPALPAKNLGAQPALQNKVEDKFWTPHKIVSASEIPAKPSVPLAPPAPVVAVAPPAVAAPTLETTSSANTNAVTQKSTEEGKD